MEWIYKKIWELKSKALTVENKERIQRLQQMLDNPTESQNLNASEKVSNNNSAKNSSIRKEEEEIHKFLYNRYNR